MIDRLNLASICFGVLDGSTREELSGLDALCPHVSIDAALTVPSYTFTLVTALIVSGAGVITPVATGTNVYE